MGVEDRQRRGKLDSFGQRQIIEVETVLGILDLPSLQLNDMWKAAEQIENRRSLSYSKLNKKIEKKKNSPNFLSFVPCDSSEVDRMSRVCPFYCLYMTPFYFNYWKNFLNSLLYYTDIHTSIHPYIHTKIRTCFVFFVLNRESSIFKGRLSPNVKELSEAGIN